jgi:single-strand DNA-binding protein
MSNSLNKVQLIGNTTADPEIKQTPQGTSVATFSIATNRKWKDTA